jgi:hypothetical protein
MTSDSGKNRKQKEQDELIQREILRERKFSIAEAIGREGGSFIKGHSPIPRLDQVISLLTIFIQNNLKDSSRVLMSVLQTTVKNDRTKVAESIEEPMVYLHGLIKSYVDNREMLYELAREVDFKWGQINDEKPHFQKPGEEPHPDDEYSHEIVEGMLKGLLKNIEENL